MHTQTITYDQEFLEHFEENINPLDPEHGRIPAHVLGYGEMSTVMTISGADPNLIFKRMPMFYSADELKPYLESYHAYLEHLLAAGVKVVPAAITSVVPSAGNIVVYIIQEKLDGRTLVNQAIHHVPDEQVEKLFAALLNAVGHVFAYNDQQEGRVALGLDAQMSNWAIGGYESANYNLPEPLELIYIDTSTPLLRLDGQEQLDTDLILRSAPSFLRGIMRWLYVEDVLNRYYMRRQVIIDVLGNLYKEKRVDMIPTLLVTANNFLEQNLSGQTFKPITAAEVAGYYKEDARIWSIYLAARRIDRRLQQLLGRPYPYVLPGHVDR